MPEILKTDALIFGGGVAGLWMLNRLRNAGYSAWLMEQNDLGAGQSIASQGIIHSGLKYVYDGTLSKASATIADMPQVWLQCLKGQGDVNLHSCRVLSPDYYMLPRDSLRARLYSLLGSKALASKTSRLRRQEFPAFFQSHSKGPMYRMADFVLDVPSLLETLQQNHANAIFTINWQEARLGKNPDGSISGLHFSNGQVIEAKQYISCCGGGTESLLKQFDLQMAPMQRRPLQQVMVRHQITDPVFVHCVSSSIDLSPELTVTSHHNSKGEPVWYLGGRLAEDGATMTADTLIDNARRKVSELFPWADFSKAQWATLAIDRAEAKQADARRPADSSMIAQHNLAVCWPTKLTLAPNLANRILAHLQSRGIVPGETSAAPDFLARPGVAPTPWEHL